LEHEPTLPRWAAPVALSIIAALVLVRLSAFGIWDPWEIEAADGARRLAEGKDVLVPHLGPWVVSLGFRSLGIDEWTGRLPIALSGLAMAGLGYALVARFAGRRAGVYTVIIAGTSPLFLLNARTMVGEAPTFAVQTAIALAACGALWPGTSSGGRRFALLVLACVLVLAGVPTRGALLCSLPPLCAVVCVGLFERVGARGRTDPVAVVSGLVLAALALCLLALVARDVVADQAVFSPWLGGQPIGGQPPSFDAAIERAFHAFAPWSALLPLALASLPALADDAERTEERPLRLLFVLWIAFSYAAITLFSSRYGHKSLVLPVVPFAGSVALLLCALERRRFGHWTVALGCAFLVLLLIRDFALYPGSPVAGMALADFQVPEVYNPKRAWAVALGVFGAVALLAIAAPTEHAPLSSLKAPYVLLRTQWRRGLGFKLWLVLFALVLVGVEVFGVLSFTSAKTLGFSSIAARWGRRLAFAPPALPVAIALAQLAWMGVCRLSRLRAPAILLAGLGVGGYAAHGFMPALSAHFSPREVYETYNELARPGEPLVEYKVGARAAAYYAKGAAVEVDTLSELLQQLTTDKRAWAVFPTDELAAIDRMFRSRKQRHLFVADARSARVTLATNLPMKGRKDQSFLSEFVRRDAPRIQHPVSANFEDKIELLGYDLKLPHKDHVGAGESFELTWYWKARRSIGGSYRVFVHIDAAGARIHGDHDPVDGKYPVRLWSEGDVIVDRQRLDVPPSYASGSYTIFVGFYSGETRLTVKSGPKDDANRVNAGVLRIR
jgi:hypothetical protein